MIPMQLLQMVNQLKSNPMSMLGRFGISQNMVNDPNAIIQNLMNQGKISQEQYNKAVQQARQMGMK